MFLKVTKNLKPKSLSKISQSKFSTKTKMYASEAFVETLQAKGVTDMFGILGSAYMDALDIFPAAGIRFISCQHEQNSVHMADGYYRVSGKTGSCIA
jgi:sulfoacetaldehyde acetyltransferase